MFINRLIVIGAALWISLFSGAAFANSSLPDTVDLVKPSIVGVGTYKRLASPAASLLGTGFVVHNGQYVATNAHVVSNLSDKEKADQLFVFLAHGDKAGVVKATIAAIDTHHDLALLKITEKPLRPLSLTSRKVREGESIAFTGFPIGAVLGLYHVTHQGIVSSIAPAATPARSTNELTAKQLKALKNPYFIYQLDATAYPGNSGSPVYDPDTGHVLAIINKVLVKSTKEALLSDPSAITFAIPVKHLQSLIDSL